MDDLNEQNATSQCSTLYILVLSCVALYSAWQYLLRTGALWNSKSQPLMLPYWVPALGHSLSFLRDTHGTILAGRKYFKNQPFSILLGGRRTYIVPDHRHMAEVWKKTKEIVYEPFIDHLMICIGVPQASRDIVWNTKPNETSTSITTYVLDMVREEVGPGPAGQAFFDKLMQGLDDVLQTGNPLTTGKEDEHGLLRFTKDIIMTASTNTFFGKVLLQNFPDILETFATFEHHAWEIIFPLPNFLVTTGRKSKDAVIDDLARYFDLPQDERCDVAAFVSQGEAAMRENGIGSRDIAALLFKMFWGINGMPSILAFWLLARAVYTPNLLEELRAEVAPAFKDGIHSRPDTEYLKTCPKLNATFHETLRVHGGAAGFRRVVSDTTVAGYTFKTGSDVIMAYRQLHIDKEIWGPDAETFDINRFIDNPKLATGKTFKPFGGGLALCYGRFLVRQTALCFLATLVTRYDMEIVGDCPFPEMDEKVPQVGVVLPKMEQIPKIRIRKVTGGWRMKWAMVIYVSAVVTMYLFFGFLTPNSSSKFG